MTRCFAMLAMVLVGCAAAKEGGNTPNGGGTPNGSTPNESTPNGSCPPDGSDASSPAAVVEACPAPPMRSDFESGLDPSWQVTDPSAFRMETERPIHGAQSLRIAFRQKASFLSFMTPNVCAVRLAFTLRADAQLLGSETTIARIVTAGGSRFHLRLGSHGLSLAEEMRSAEAAGISFGMPFANVAPDTALTMAVTVD